MFSQLLYTSAYKNSRCRARHYCYMTERSAQTKPIPQRWRWRPLLESHYAQRSASRPLPITDPIAGILWLPNVQPRTWARGNDRCAHAELTEQSRQSVQIRPHQEPRRFILEDTNNAGPLQVDGSAARQWQRALFADHKGPSLPASYLTATGNLTTTGNLTEVLTR